MLVCNRQRAVAVDLERVSAFAREAGDEEVEISLVSDRRMAALHRQFLHLRGTTDVLTFPHGEIIIAVPVAQRAARAHGEILEREICRYLVHGLLHLRGHDDKLPAERRRMWRAQERLLNRLWPAESRAH